MKPKKLNFSEIKSTLSRDEMKKIMAGSGSCQEYNQICDSRINLNCCTGLTCTTEGCKHPNLPPE
jgi:hypothetical protein